MPKRAEPTGFGRRLKELREAAGLTQDGLAEGAGLYKFSVAKLEQGIREPTWSTVLALAKVLGVSVAAFVTEEDTAGTAPAVPRAEPVSAVAGELEGAKKKRQGRPGKRAT